MARLYPSYLITGASSGIGRALAVELATRANKAKTPLALALVARRRPALEETQRLVLQAYPEAFVHVCILDVNQSYEEIEQAYAQCHEAFNGPIHCFVINAGIAGGPRFIGDEQGFDSDRQIAVTNFVGAITCIDAAVKYIKANQVNKTTAQAHIVSVSSVASTIPVPSQAVYSASKAGLNTYMRNLQVETNGLGIHVTNLKPGYIDTPINDFMASRPFVIHVNEGAKIIADRIASRYSNAFIPRFPWCLVPSLVAWVPDSWLMRSVKQMIPSDATAAPKQGM
ncbi:hypothetical protein BCR44DRAFT_1487434 [Catenaria anguillulae PL171]|uniref:Ketoreductase domain-containing protein n=1 Tax=Catenaria anguillulae PL171 TaxID=765915 RepID=A0A1Y2HDA9_9FUNG|nr:hypothetical protein BCR44DRAFT_1487434 [Catenaria anguillulae PL171]